jgi:chemotaxis protein MotB
MLNVRFREKTNAWPGFVDLFSNLVIILIFLLIVFVFLWTTTSVFNKHSDANKVAELKQENQAQAEKIDQMAEDNQTAEELLLRARDALEVQEAEKVQLADNFEQQKEDIANAYEQQIDALSTQQAELAEKIAALTEQLQQSTVAREEMKRIESERSEMTDKLLAERVDLNARINELTAELEKAEELAKQKEVEYTAMSDRLNKALADKVAELNTMSQYQSAFYRDVKNALGDRTTIKQEGDRFIVSSDILFRSGSYKISDDGKKQLKLLANIIKDFEEKIPSDIDWIIRVDGHTDNKSVVAGTPYKDNMQLSLLRATAVTNELVKNGVSKRRLVPSGFGELHPIALGNDKDSLQKNRRIELQLTNK